MKRKQMDCQTLADAIMKQVGEIEPVGETNADKQRLNNLILLTNTIDCLMDEIFDAAMARNRVEYSMKEIGDYSAAWLEATYNHIDDYFDE